MPADVSAYTPLANLTLSSATNVVNFTSISQSYRDLVCIISARSASGTGSINANRINADATGNYRYLFIQGTSGTGQQLAGPVANATEFPLSAPNQNLNTSAPSVTTLNFIDYTRTGVNKNVLVRSDNSTMNSAWGVITWTNTNAITQFRIQASINFAIGSTFALYGVSA
jgi:hypothetical protein